MGLHRKGCTGCQHLCRNSYAPTVCVQVTMHTLASFTAPTVSESVNEDFSVSTVTSGELHIVCSNSACSISAGWATLLHAHARDLLPGG